MYKVVIHGISTKEIAELIASNLSKIGDSRQILLTITIEEEKPIEPTIYPKTSPDASWNLPK